MNNGANVQKKCTLPHFYGNLNVLQIIEWYISRQRSHPNQSSE